MEVKNRGRILRAQILKMVTKTAIVEPSKLFQGLLREFTYGKNVKGVPFSMEGI